MSCAPSHNRPVRRHPREDVRGWRPRGDTGSKPGGDLTREWEASAAAHNPIRHMVNTLYKLAKEHSNDVKYWDRTSEPARAVTAKITQHEVDEPGGDEADPLDAQSQEEKRHFHEIMHERHLRDEPLTRALMRLHLGYAMAEGYDLLKELEDVVAWHEQYSDLLHEEHSLPARLRKAIDTAKEFRTPEGVAFFDAMRAYTRIHPYDKKHENDPAIAPASHSR